METPIKRRILAVVGRPNVGKSALFNRISGKRIAIVNDESGVTRDRLVRQVTWHEQKFELVDTGGVNLLHEKSEIQSGIIDQVKAALEEAAAVILVVDVQSGLTPLDIDVARMIRKVGVPCHVAVNKCDVPSHETSIHEFEKLGYPLYPISVLHDRGIDPLLKDTLQLLPNTQEESITNPLRVAIVGKPNAGKSSYINRLLKSDRVIVSNIAGTTRDSIEIPFTIGTGAQARHYNLIDTAGMRHFHSIDTAVERYSHMRSQETIKNADIVILVMDAQVGPTTQDKRIAALIAKENKSCIILVNKWDTAQETVKERGVTQTQYEPALRKVMPFFNHCPVIFISAKSGYNIRRSLEIIDEVSANTRAKLSTGLLNRVINEAYERIKPPSSGKKHFKIFYATQTGYAPIRIRIFVNDTSIPSQNYTSYLIKAVRDAFGLEGVPVLISYRERSRKETRQNEE